MMSDHISTGKEVKKYALYTTVHFEDGKRS